VVTFEDTTSHSQNENLHTIVDFHNSQTRDLDVSVHFNSNGHTSKPMGTMTLYYSQEELAGAVSAAVAAASGLKNKGVEYRPNLMFLNSTDEPAILIEVCFVTSEADVILYQDHFDALCRAIAETIGGNAVPQPEPPLPEGAFYARGTCSWFGGPEDEGVSPSEGLAFFYEVSDAPHLFLPTQPSGTTGLARRLNPGLMYIACRWDYNRTPKSMLARWNVQALVRARGKEFLAWPADWGPHEEQTGRAADLSPALMRALGVETDDEVEVIYPAP
jgi:hypothetical protein